jgi:hypothetical protein
MAGGLKRFILLLLSGLFIFSASSCSSVSSNKDGQKARVALKRKPIEKNPYARARIELKTYMIDPKDEKKGWGYDVFIFGGMVIHQPNIPAVNGNRAFSTKEDAEKVGNFAIDKIKRNIMPPALSIEELESLGVLN